MPTSSIFATPAPRVPQLAFTPSSVRGLVTPGFANQASTPQQRNMENTVIPVTVLQLERFCPDGKSLNGKPFKAISMTGQIRNVQIDQTKCEFILDDGTGLIQCIWYQIDEMIKNVVNLNCYVKIYGGPKVENGQFTMNIYHVRQINSYNEITHHMLETCHAHKLRQAKKIGNINVGPSGAMNLNNEPQTQKNEMVNRLDFNQEEKDVGAVGNIGNLGDAQINSNSVPFEKEITEIFSQGDPEKGISVDVCVESIGVQHVQTIRASIVELTNRGDIYETTEDHFTSTSHLE